MASFPPFLKIGYILVPLTLLALWLAGFMVFLSHIKHIPAYNSNRTADAIIVFTGGPDRINRGLDLLHEQKADKLFISGVHSHVPPGKVLQMWRPDLAPDKYPCCMELGYSARNTVQNAIETGEWIKKNGQIKSVLLVTAHFHLPRAVQELRRRIPPETVIYQYPVIPANFDYGNIQFWRIVFEEYHKLVFNRIKLFLLQEGTAA